MFRFMNILSRNNNTLHKNIKKFVCNECRVVYSQGHNVRMHLETIHIKGRVTEFLRGHLRLAVLSYQKVRRMFGNYEFNVCISFMLPK